MEILYFILVISYVFLLIILSFSWIRLPKNDLSMINSCDLPKVSIVISLRNEAPNVSSLIQSLLHQTYQQFDIILIDDHSEDATYSLLKKNLTDKIQLYQLPEHLKGKKQAIRFGIERTDAKLIITTDADCLHQKDWVSTFVGIYIRTKSKMISGPVRFSYQNSLFQKIMNAEFGSLILTGAASIGLKKPNMCNGANLCFEKNAFLEQNDYALHAHIPTGDDEFFLHQLAKENPEEIVFAKEKAAIVTTSPPADVHQFIQQRVRWGSKWRYYQNKSPLIGSIFIFLFHLCFFITFFSIFFGSGNYTFFIATIIVKAIIETIYNQLILRWQGDKRNIYLLPFISLCYPFYAVFIGILSTVGNYQWKNRFINGK